MRSDNPRELPISVLLRLFFFFPPALPQEEQQGWNLGQPHVSFLQKCFLLLKPSKWENGNSSSSPGVICHAASETSQALLW